MSETAVFYTAGSKHHQKDVQEIAAKLREAGYTVNSRWLEVSKQDHEVDEEYLQKMAVWDLEDVMRADALIYCNHGYKSEGKATELGVSIAMMKPIIVIGGKENNIFLNLPGLPFFATIEEAIAKFKELESE
jgi:nucleoside 2-deoxyribosyltransferase